MGQTVTKRILLSLSDLIRTRNPLDDLKEHISIDEQRRAVRIYVDYPLEIEFSGMDLLKSPHKGKSVNLSESGILINLKMKEKIWEDIMPQIENSHIVYHFKMPDELKADRIEGRVKRFIEKRGKKNGKIELEFGIQNETEGPVDKLNLLDYINGRLMDSINNDIDHIEKLMKDRELTPSEKDIYNTLLNDYSDRN